MFRKHCFELNVISISKQMCVVHTSNHPAPLSLYSPLERLIWKHQLDIFGGFSTIRQATDQGLCMQLLLLNEHVHLVQLNLKWGCHRLCWRLWYCSFWSNLIPFERPHTHRYQTPTNQLPGHLWILMYSTDVRKLQQGVDVIGVGEQQGLYSREQRAERQRHLLSIYIRNYFSPLTYFIQRDLFIYVIHIFREGLGAVL